MTESQAKEVCQVLGFTTTQDVRVRKKAFEDWEGVEMIEAMKQALEALEAHADIGIKSDKAIDSLRQAIEQVEKQEPVKPEWVGLTGEELEIIAFHYLASVGDYWVNEFTISERNVEGFAEAISAKLKEKNHG
jgi:hypothetical protein